jgi:hypothetical protein
LRLVLVLAAMAGTAAAQGSVQLRVRPDAVGDVYRYRSETRFTQRDDAGAATQANSQVFELEVLGVEAGGLRLRYTLKAAELTDSGGASMGAALKAQTGGVLEFRLARDGSLAAVDNWPAYRTRMLERVDAALPAGDPVRAMVHEQMDQPPLTAAAEAVLGDVKLMALMEPQETVPLGARDVGADQRLEISMIAPGCVVRVKRGLAGGATGMGQAITAEAEVSVADGRVLTLEHRRVLRTSGGMQEESVTIRRLSPAPACPR